MKVTTVGIDLAKNVFQLGSLASMTRHVRHRQDAGNHRGRVDAHRVPASNAVGGDVQGAAFGLWALHSCLRGAASARHPPMLFAQFASSDPNRTQFDGSHEARRALSTDGRLTSSQPRARAG